MKQYIPELEKLDLTVPLPEIWKGALGHIGPVQTVTKQVDMLAGKTTCGTVTMMSAMLLWGVKRLESFTDVSFMYELAESSFAWQLDWRYFDAKQEPKGMAPDYPIEKSAAHQLVKMFKAKIRGADEWHSFYQPIMELSHMTHIVRYLLPNKVKRKEFKLWLDAIVVRMDTIALAPDLNVPNIDDFENEEAYDAYCAPRRGNPLPPLVLNLNENLENVNLVSEAQKFVQSLDYSKNRFLRSPEEMKELGFVGEPYTS